MINIQKAIELTLGQLEPVSSTHERKLSESLSYVLAKDLYSNINMPPFRQSAMDGYAINIGTTPQYRLIGEIQAGDAKNPVLQKGEAIRIFTGAPVPDSANAVIMQEKVKAEGDLIQLETEPRPSENIRPLGEQIRKGQLALENGTLIRDSTIGYLAALGTTHIEVYDKPKIGIIITGNELAEAGADLKHGQIYESNFQMLSASLNSQFVSEISFYKAKDNLDDTVNSIRESIEKNDFSIISGGISVGDYDFVAKALDLNKVEKIFHKVKQKPGKPLYFGKKGQHTIFGLPGNPAAALSCFYIYVLPAIKKWQHHTDYHLKWTKYESLNSFKRKPGRPQFLKAKVKDEKVEILDGQNSSMLHTFAVANALCFIEEDVENIEKGEALSCYKLYQ